MTKDKAKLEEIASECKLISQADISLDVVTDSYTVSPFGLEFARSVDYDQWFECGLLLKALEERQAVIAMWLWGDWLNYGEGSFSDRYLQAINVTGLAASTIDNFKRVSANIDRSVRRFTTLRQRHWIVSLREKDSLVRNNLLQQADDEDWTVQEFETHLPPTKSKTPPPGTDEDTNHELEVENRKLQELSAAHQFKLSGMTAMNTSVEERLRELENSAVTGDLEMSDLATEIHSIRDDMVTQVSIITDDDGELTKKVVTAIGLWRDEKYEQLALIMDELCSLVGYGELIEVSVSEDMSVSEEVPEWLN